MIIAYIDENGKFVEQITKPDTLVRIKNSIIVFINTNNERLIIPTRRVRTIK